MSPTIPAENRFRADRSVPPSFRAAQPHDYGHVKPSQRCRLCRRQGQNLQGSIDPMAKAQGAKAGWSSGDGVVSDRVQRIPSRAWEATVGSERGGAEGPL